MGSASGLTGRRAALVAAGLVILVWLFLWWWSRPPQMGADEEVARAVDTLFTAVTARDERLLGRCAERLHARKEAGKLPPQAWDYLDGVVRQARAGSWRAAAEQLYAFMRAQRREEPPIRDN